MSKRTFKTHLVANMNPILTASLVAYIATSIVPVSQSYAKVGVTAAVNQDAKSARPGQPLRVLSLGKNVVFNERIETKGAGLVQVLLVDGTTFTVGPNSRLTIDEFVYDPGSGTAKVVATVTKGAFRFIGGQASRKKGGVTIKTPTGTIGIRGGMVDGLISGDAGKSFFSMLFGKEVNFTGISGRKARIYKAGYTLDINGANGSTNIRRRTKADVNAIQSSLAGRKGTSGGAKQQPTETKVANSPLTQTNSGAPTAITVPTPKPKTVQSTSIDTAEKDVAEIDVATQETVVKVAKQVVAAQTPKPTRVVTIGTVYSTIYKDSQGNVVVDELGNPGSRGLIGGDKPGADRVINFISKNGRLIGNTPSGDINLPDHSGTEGDTATTAINVVDGTSPKGNITGKAYAGRGDFVAYMLNINGDETKPFYVLYGTETDIPKLESFDSGTDIRQYQLTRDPLQNLPVPYLVADIYGVVTNYNSTNLYVVEPNQSISNEVEVFSTWTDINGSGASQKSAIHVLADAFYTDGSGATRLYSSRRGSFRHNSSAPSVNLRGGLGTNPGGSGGHFFGANAEHFVIGSVYSENGGYYDSAAGPGLFSQTGNFTGYQDDGNSGTQHVASLVSETPQANFTRTSRQGYGFMVGFNEQRYSPTYPSPRSNTPFIVASGNYNGAPNFSMYTNAQNNGFGAQGVVSDFLNVEPDVTSMLLTFGAWGGSGGGNTFVDDNKFGAVQNRDRSKTSIRYSNGTTANQISASQAGSYIVSGRAAPIAGYQHCTTCSFANWGWWGTRIRVDDPGTSPTKYGNRGEHVHMGTWVAGDITKPSDLPTTMSATYNGTALGTVARNIGTPNLKQYIAKGDLNMTWDFNARTGTLAINNFDGFNLSGPIVNTSTTNKSLFGGNTLSGSGINGAASGAFVNDGAIKAAGVIGQFGFGDGSTVQAVGTFVGKR